MNNMSYGTHHILCISTYIHFLQTHLFILFLIYTYKYFKKLLLILKAVGN